MYVVGECSLCNNLLAVKAVGKLVMCPCENFGLDATDGYIRVLGEGTLLQSFEETNLLLQSRSDIEKGH